MEARPVATAQAELARFITDTSCSGLPDAFREKLKLSLLDSLGCGLYGANTAWAKIVSGYAARQGTGASRIWGAAGAAPVPPAAAVLANATMIHSFEIDDVHFGSRSHPGSVTIPVAFAIAEDQMISGAELLAGLAVGYETLVRVGACQGVSSFSRGWHPTGTAGVFGAAATSAKLLGLPRQTIIHALGIAGTMPCGLMAAQYGAMVKRFYAGHAAWAGYTAAMLANDGLTGIEDIFEADYGGYPKALSDQVMVDAIGKELGTVFEAARIGYKLFSCVGTNHTALQAVTDLMCKHQLKANQIQRIRIQTSEYQVLHSGWPYKPGTIMAAQMNMQYCVAVLLLQGSVFVDQFNEEFLADPEILALAARIDVVTDADQKHNDRKAKVRVSLNDGTVYEGSCSAARGHPDNPPGWKEIEEKFRILASKTLPDQKCDRIVELIANIEEVDDLSELASLMVAEA